MKQQAVIQLAMAAAAQAGVLARDTTSDPCITTTTLPTATVTLGKDGIYTQACEVVYDDFCECEEGIRPKTYTLMQTCDKPICDPKTDEPPAGFTCAAVECSTCDNGAPTTLTLTFPTESAQAYESKGYKVYAAPTQDAEAVAPTQEAQGAAPTYATPGGNGNTAASPTETMAVVPVGGGAITQPRNWGITLAVLAAGLGYVL